MISCRILRREDGDLAWMRSMMFRLQRVSPATTHRAAAVMTTPKSTSIFIIGSPYPFLRRLVGRLFYRRTHHSMLELIVKLLQILIKGLNFWPFELLNSVLSVYPVVKYLRHHIYDCVHVAARHRHRLRPVATH
jgi:hypothetical protein